MRKTYILGFLAMIMSIASYALGPFSPPSAPLCVGSSILLVDSTDPGGTWASSNTAIATIGATSGLLTGVSAGVVTITYTLSSAYVTGTFTVYTVPTAIIGGGSSFCTGTTVTLSDAVSGGTWSSSSTYHATVGAGTGVVTGMHGGNATISYTMPGGCAVTKTVTVDATTIGAITGATSVCTGSSTTYTDTPGVVGTWTSANTAVATIGSSSGVLTGVSADTVIITFTTTGGTCGSASVTKAVAVLSTTATGTIYGSSSLHVGTSITLAESIPGGTWSSSTTGVATISSAGVVTAISTGTTIISYAVSSGCSGLAYATKTITVNSLNGISGHVLFGSGSYSGIGKVWLIRYNTGLHTLEATDSIYMLCSSSSSFYYEFPGLPSDSFRIKAAIHDTGISTCYIPTYHTSAFYWYSASVINHISGASDINKDINMSIGTVTSGPGFIAGDVTTGANKGTSGSSPAEGIHMVLINSATSQLMQQTYTDAAGHYSFSSLPVGQTYNVFPDVLNYGTIPYTAITLTAANPVVSSASFEQHTISKTITPKLVGVPNIIPTVSSVTAFPNPTNGKLYIQWNEIAPENGTITISDITGHVLYNTTVSMTQGAGMKQIDLSSFANGMYVVSVKSATINYTNKVQVQH